MAASIASASDRLGVKPNPPEARAAKNATAEAYNDSTLTMSDHPMSSNMLADGNPLNQFEPLTVQQHILSKLTAMPEVATVRLAPVFEAAVTFAFVIGKLRVYLVEPALRKLSRLNHCHWSTRAVT